MKDLGGILLGGFFFIVAIMLLPRVLSQVTASNAAIAAQNQPQAAWNRAQAQWLGTAGNIGASVLNNFAESHDATYPNY